MSYVLVEDTPAGMWGTNQSVWAERERKTERRRPKTDVTGERESRNWIGVQRLSA